MKNTKLFRQHYLSPNMEALNEMRDYLDELIASANSLKDTEWKNSINKIIEFQDEDGGFNLLDSYEIESDSAVHFCLEPTYICTAILIKAFMEEGVFAGKENEILVRALKVSARNGFTGHGYDFVNDMIRGVSYFARCNVKAFLEKHPDMCIEFTNLFINLEKSLRSNFESGKLYAGWGNSIDSPVEEILEALPRLNLIFVYGTLMKGQANHDSFLRNAKYLGDGKISNYIMYNLGSFPGIKEGEGEVQGEVYSVTKEELERINRLEGEGSLYIKKETEVLLESGEKIAASVYVYNRSVEGCERLFEKYDGIDYVWYVAYGSNLLSDRLKYYIQGGTCVFNNKFYHPCSDTTLPKESKPVTIPYDMYYSNYDQGSWEKSAVSFLDISHPGMAYGRAYKIKRSQLPEIHAQEGKGSNWYPECIRLNDIEGREAYTFANRTIKPVEPFSRVSSSYACVLVAGMQEAYPEKNIEEIYEYLSSIR